MIKIGKANFCFGGARFQFDFLFGGGGRTAPRPPSATGLLGNKSEQAMQTYADIGSMTAKQEAATCAFLAM